ncbi:molecular chaperone DnaJ [Haloarchaeobius sp. HME9146]|uniref:molecular chaperone DnaJ n=1 Tax=Haloarchaeobius sp. HME9146 TaxID=2978732 RepID=UPI0021C0E72A|nr:molecular chaperone DnaJ [Haloarchaeobius sp. HME9146]MCT9096011.1 molecular chaperone DnaJ [Haloarchaeobius sp. HME9146]
MSEDFYDALGVSRDASEDEIKQAYRKKAAEYHPDVSDAEDAEEKFKQVKKAKEVLTDEEKRQAYDQMGHDRFKEAEKRGGFDGRGGMGGGAGGFGGGGGPFGGGAGGMGDINDIFEQFFGGGGQRGQGQRDRGPRPGRDLRTRTTLDLEDVYHGIEKQVTITRPEHCDTCEGHGHPPEADSETCANCNGQGRVTKVQQTPLGRVQQTQACRQCEGEGEIYDETCDDCRGRGIVEAETTLTVEIPAGIRDGQSVRLGGEGAPGDPGAPKGDLLIEVSVDQSGDFERDGDDLYYRLPISFPQAVFGDTIEIETFGGSVEIDIDEGTQSGETIRIRGEGMPRLRRSGHGDLYVQVQVVTPDSLNEEQREALEAFAEAGGEEVEVKKGFWKKIKNSF